MAKYIPMFGISGNREEMMHRLRRLDKATIEESGQNEVKRKLMFSLACWGPARPITPRGFIFFLALAQSVHSA
jgi:hypothetical protein